MKSKAPLIMMEQMVMILVFALAAALCLQAFVLSDRISEKDQARDTAVVLCQNAAEAIQASGGDMAEAAALLGANICKGDSLMINYDRDWGKAQGLMRYTLGASRLESDVPGLGSASVWMRDEAEGEELFRINVSWQEVVP